MRQVWVVIIVVFFATLGIVAGGYWRHLTTRVVTPLATGAASTPDPILTEVKGVKTTSQYPPSRYFPKRLTPVFTDDLAVTAHAYAAMDRDTGELLLAKNLDVERPIASLTKIMTAIIALEEYLLDSQFVVSNSAANIGEAFMGVTAGEVLRVEDLVYGVMLPSGNDAAEVLVEALSPDSGDAVDLAQRNRQWFIDRMNARAQAIGMHDTYFANPTGLDERLMQLSTFSTPLDLLALANYALDNQTFARIAATDEYVIPYRQDRHKAFFLYNILQMEGSFPGIRGIKPGITEFAGETLVSYLERDGRRIILVLLGSSATRDDAIKAYTFLLQQKDLSNGQSQNLD